ncbi:MAG: lactate racemase domain-containing protein [Anaerolineales bacterium]|nr:lactate racemase domain-containing protein [Anaerolineales bacterium]
MIDTQAVSQPGFILEDDLIRHTLQTGLGGKFQGQKVLVLIPDHTRSLPLPMLFRTRVNVLHDAKQLDFMVALGTHPPLDENSLNALVGISSQERRGKYAKIRLLNHRWDLPAALETIGMLSGDHIRQIAGDHWHPSLGGDVPIRVNKTALGYDQLLILGPTFPHEVAGFSGGAKYLFPGISGPEMINATHWLGALAGVPAIIGVKNTPVRAMIHAAEAQFPRPVTLVAMVVEGRDLAGIFIGGTLEAWSAAADLSSERHIYWKEKPFRRVLSCAPAMYDELWTAGKAMYKLEPVMAPGGEVLIYAPHLETVSHVHGRYIYEIGYHCLPYFLQNWGAYQHIPLGVVAHSTHVRGAGALENGVEVPNLRVTLASKISPQDCARLNLGYCDPASIDIRAWQDREEEGILYVPKAGEILYRVKGPGR